MHIVGKENMEVFLSKLHYLWNVISLFRIFASNFYDETEERLEIKKWAVFILLNCNPVILILYFCLASKWWGSDVAYFYV